MGIEQIPRLRIVVGALAAGALFSQVFLTPLVANGFAETYPGAAYLASPYAIAVIVATGGLEAILLAVWQLLSIAQRGENTAGTSARWANFATGGLIFSAAIMAIVFAHATFAASVGGPPVFFGFLASIALGGGAPALSNAMKRNLLQGDREELLVEAAGSN